MGLSRFLVFLKREEMHIYMLLGLIQLRGGDTNTRDRRRVFGMMSLDQQEIQDLICGEGDCLGCTCSNRKEVRIEGTIIGR